MILVATSPAPCVEMAQSQEIDSAVTCRSTRIRPFNDAGNSFSAWARETPSPLIRARKHYATRACVEVATATWAGAGVATATWAGVGIATATGGVGVGVTTATWAGVGVATAT